MRGHPDIIATVRFYATEARGRKGATPPQIFGCPLEFDSEKFDCRLLLQEVGALVPGAAATAPIEFLFPELVKPD